jgi:ABC-type glycerol-3-phosphate transport system permease component
MKRKLLAIVAIALMAGALIASAPQIALFLGFRDQIVKGIAMTGIKG